MTRSKISWSLSTVVVPWSQARYAAAPSSPETRGGSGKSVAASGSAAASGGTGAVSAHTVQRSSPAARGSRARLQRSRTVAPVSSGSAGIAATSPISVAGCENAR